ncbi:MAG: DUF1294 domain-containing protein [Verrucomicrobia bacterium]|nr:DUF1294 domain-containing protein [Verrucomicrobiota bacterium]
MNSRRKTRSLSWPERPTLSWLIAGLVLCVLAGLPVLALVKVSQHVPGFWLLGYSVVVSLLAFLFCASDKRQAKDGQWRTPENLLHFLELIGGWPGSFVAQHRFRHKVKKGNYQLIFWLIVAGYQLIAAAYVFDLGRPSEAVRAYFDDLARKVSFHYAE